MVRTDAAEEKKKPRSKRKASEKQKQGLTGKGAAGVWPCDTDGCTKQFAREADLKRHRKTTKLHSMPGFACPHCDAAFTRPDAQKRHQKSRHSGPPPPVNPNPLQAPSWSPPSEDEPPEARPPPLPRKQGNYYRQHTKTVGVVHSPASSARSSTPGWGYQSSNPHYTPSPHYRPSTLLRPGHFVGPSSSTSSTNSKRDPTPSLGHHSRSLPPLTTSQSSRSSHSPISPSPPSTPVVPTLLWGEEGGLSGVRIRGSRFVEGYRPFGSLIIGRGDGATTLPINPNRMAHDQERDIEEDTRKEEEVSLGYGKHDVEDEEDELELTTAEVENVLEAMIKFTHGSPSEPESPKPHHGSTADMLSACATPGIGRSRRSTTPYSDFRKELDLDLELDALDSKEDIDINSLPLDDLIHDYHPDSLGDLLVTSAPDSLLDKGFLLTPPSSYGLIVDPLLHDDHLAYTPPPLDDPTH